MSLSFEDLDVWKKACRLAVDLYKILKSCKDYGLKDQICRSAVSVASNIAEGRERKSNAEFIRFLNIALGSASELRTQIYIATEIELISKSDSSDIIKRCKSLSQMIQALINSIKTRSTVDGERLLGVRIFIN